MQQLEYIFINFMFSIYKKLVDVKHVIFEYLLQNILQIYGETTPIIELTTISMKLWELLPIV